MKSLLRAFIYNLVCLFLATLIIPGFSIEGGVRVLLFASIVFTLLNFFLKPLIKILLFPINFITLGLFSFLVNVIIIYVLIYFVSQIKITPWTFYGFSYQGFSIPTIYFTNFLTILIASFLLSIFFNILMWIRK